ncbi:MAG TPA: hypothetical protein VHS09_06875 [Polyangiaceae bacterium]|jgi:hypothetical protein|nr:hypothetical protein [Polyangiaceae bacterium]
MTTSNEATNENTKPAVENEDLSSSPAAEDAPAADEFKLTIRKLEMPVRPRGVLAE